MLPQQPVSHSDIYDYPLIPWKEVMCSERNTTNSRLHPSSCQLSPAGCWGRHWQGKHSLPLPSLTHPHPILRELGLPKLGHAMWATTREGSVPPDKEEDIPTLLQCGRYATCWNIRLSSNRTSVTDHGDVSSPPLACVCAISLSVFNLFIFRLPSAPFLRYMGHTTELPLNYTEIKSETD